MTQAGQVDIRKKKNFEDQQRRLLALKQKGGPKTQKDNPLKDMFGNKDSSFNTSSLLGPLGNAPKSKNINAGFQGNEPEMCWINNEIPHKWNCPCLFWLHA